MARVTVEDCIDKVDNRFELVLLASHRARLISQGAAITIDRDNDKNPVVALREIAEETQSAEVLRERMIESHQTQIEEMIRALRNEAPLSVDGAQARNAVALISALYKSAESGAAVDVSSL